MGAFPNFRRPRVVWMDMQPRAPFGELAGRSDTVLETLGFAAEWRPCRAHMARGRMPDALDATSAAHLSSHVAATCRASGGMQVRSVALMRSAFSRQGPSYSLLSAFFLRGS